MDTGIRWRISTLFLVWTCTFAQDSEAPLNTEITCHPAPDRKVFGQAPLAATNTMSQCIAYCTEDEETDQQYTYAATRPYHVTQSNVECYCGWAPPNTTGGSCNFTCPGDNSQMCGGLDQNSSPNMAAVSSYLPLTDEFLLVADSVSRVIHQVALSGVTSAPLFSDDSSPVAIDYDPDTGRVYWSDLTHQALKATDLYGTNQTVLLQLEGGSAPHGLAVDPQAQLLFYSDSRLGTINLLRLDNSDHIPIIADVGQVRNIKLDPIYRQIYWTDWDSAKIEKASYDGSDRQVLLTLTDALITGLALDLRDRLLYWTDGQNNTVMVANLDGTEQRVLYRQSDGQNADAPAHFYGLALDQFYVYFTDWFNRTIQRVDFEDGTWETIGPQNLELMQGLYAYDSFMYTEGEASACQEKNGDCTHYCIPIFEGITCACPVGLTLQADGRTCQGEQTLTEDPELIWLEFDGTNTGYIRGIIGHPDEYLVSQQVNTWSISHNSWHWTALDIHYGRRSLFLVDKLDRLVVEMSLDESHSISVLHYGTSTEVNGIAVDWSTDNVYWTDAMYNWIMLCKGVEGEDDRTKILLRTGVDKPHGIAVHPQRGYIFWADWGVDPKIERATLAGENRTILVARRLDKPTGIAVDYNTDRVFWTNQLAIESISLDGTDRQTYAEFISNNFVDLSLQGNYLFVTDASNPGPQLWFYDRGGNSTLGIHLQLPRQPYGVAMFHPERQPEFTSPCDSASCAHFCVQTPSITAQCLCADGFELQANGTCREHSNLLGDSMYVYSLGDRLCMVTVQAATSTLISQPSVCFFNSTGIYNFHAISLSFTSGDLYFSETNHTVRTIRRANVTNYVDNGQIIFGTGEVDGLAVDWVSENLYWTDKTYRQVNVARLDGSYQKTLYKRQAEPTALVIDPVSKYMFWIERPSSGPVRIVRGLLDGSPEASLPLTNTPSPTGLAIDYTRNQLLWIDNSTRMISYLDLATYTQFHLPTSLEDDSTFQPYDLTVMEDYLVVSFKNTATGKTGIHVIERESGSPVHNGIMQTGSTLSPYDVITFDSRSQPFVYQSSNSCAFQNGGCSQLCLPGRTGYTCHCVAGMQLAEDGRGCVAAFILSNNFFLIADDYNHAIYQIKDDLTSTSAIMAAPQERPIALTYDYKNIMVYWSEFNEGLIRRSPINALHAETISNYRSRSASMQYEVSSGSRVDGLAFEPHSRLLYFSDMGDNVIGIKNPTGMYQKLLLFDLDMPRAIVLDPSKGHMYFGQKGQIARADMDGVNQIALATDLGWPRGIAIDFQEEQLYWCDKYSENIGVMDLDGSNQHILKQLADHTDPFSITFANGYLYWTDWRVRGVSRMKTDGSDLTTVLEDVVNGANEILYYANENINDALSTFVARASAVPTSCIENNGGCSHFCIPTPNGQQCACPDDPVSGTVIPADGFNCAQSSACPLISIPHGYFTTACTAELGSVCPFNCSAGYTRTTNQNLTCEEGLQWNLNPVELCADVFCPLLLTPAHAVLDPNCPSVGGLGTTCQHTCAVNYTVASGAVTRICRMVDNVPQWVGEPVVCQYDPPSALPISQAGDTNLILGIAVAAVLCLIAVIILIVILARRRMRKSARARSLESRHFDSPDSRQMEPPVESATAYDASTDRVIIDPSMAFDNPGYMRHVDLPSREQTRRGQRHDEEQASALPQKEGIEDNNANTSFENPLYGEGAKPRHDFDVYETLPADEKMKLSDDY